MKKAISILLTLFFALTAVTAGAYDMYIAPEANDILIEFSNDNSLVMMKHIKRFQKYNSWYIYSVTTDTEGNLQLKGLAEVKDDMRGDTFISEEIPADVVISGINSDSPVMSGMFQSTLRKAGSSTFHHDQWMIAKSLADYMAYPEEYSRDSVSCLTTNAYALVNSYKENSTRRANTAFQLKRDRDTQEKSGNSMFVGLLLIPLLASLILCFLTSGRRISNGFRKKVWAVAITETAGFILIVCLIPALYTFWWVVALAVIAFLIIQVCNVFFGWSVKNYISEISGNRFPLFPAVVYGVVSLTIPNICTILLCAVLGLFSDINMEISVSQILIGVAVMLAIVLLAAFWYRMELIRRAPSLKGSFIPVAILTTFAVSGIMSLLLFLIALYIFKGTGKAFLQEGDSGQSDGVRKSDDSFQTCQHCGRLRDSTCPFFKTEGSAVNTCSSWIP